MQFTDKFKSNPGGFTFIELMIVIAIVLILAAIVFNEINTGIQRAAAARNVIHFQTIEESMQTNNLELATSMWPDQTGTLNDPGNTVASIISNDSTPTAKFPNISNSLTSSPEVLFGDPFTYAKVGTYVCDSTNGVDNLGVVLRIPNLDPQVYDMMEEIVDDTIDPLCGKLRLLGSDNSAYYLLAETEDDV